MMEDAGLRIHRTRSAVVEAARSIIDDAEENLTVALPASELSDFESSLRDAVERGALVLLLIHGAPTDADRSYGDRATAVRVIERGMAPLLVTADVRHGLTGQFQVLTSPSTASRSQVTEFANRNLAYNHFTMFLGNYWQLATERYVAERSAFPQTFTEFRFAVLEAALAMRDGVTLEARARVVPTAGGPETTVEGTVTNVRQNIVYPASSPSPAERSLTVAVDGESVTIGGLGATKETYECFEVTLERKG
ncbi:TrmB family transcriptional regulator sugar-binding domain-containing protein [Haloarcula salina]|uniref:Transcription regulator TrmB C-terminal domain-containing protein n=2 Tax=Haloarcula salina TaxID=1429914 RepID=A0AA41G2Y3_9EURY|nr:TrmB family transcriptional regulator sugar-binding domain-containing protein [Haloarcula salina]MBV0903195.1 hypothetical protein [Haloarcula salina]